MKICTACEQEKTLNQFRRDKNSPDGYQRYCKLCASTKVRKVYKERYAEKARERSITRSRDNQKRIHEYKQRLGCSKCPEKDPICLAFHHQNDKSFTIGERTTMKWESLEQEIRKCIVVCHNCHAKIHYYGE